MGALTLGAIHTTGVPPAMTNRAILESLFARVLEGTGPDRELDADIEACLTGRVTHPRAPGWTFETQDTELKLARLVDIQFISRVSRPAPPYTASLDAALKLVPEGWRWAVSTTNDDSPCAFGHPPDKSFWIEDTPAATPALALCAFALRARAAIDTPHDP